jgi:YD repeat-containing protein
LHKDVRDFRGKTLSYDYDSMDRLVTKTLPQVTSGVDVGRTTSYREKTMSHASVPPIASADEQIELWPSRSRLNNQTTRDQKYHKP